MYLEGRRKNLWVTGARIRLNVFGRYYIRRVSFRAAISKVFRPRRQAVFSREAPKNIS
jgi:hypothetical protein